MLTPKPLFLCGLLVLLAQSTFAADQPDERFPLFSYLTGNGNPTMVTYTPSELGPRNEANQLRLPTSSIRADLEALRPAFDGLILYGYHGACTPRIAADLKYRAIILAVWDPKSTAEIDGVAELARQFEKQLAIGVLLGNEGLTFFRYAAFDLPWKSEESKLEIEKSWGLLSARRQPYPSFDVWKTLRGKISTTP